MLARAGWAVALTKLDGGTLARVGMVWGHLPGFTQDNYRAEVYAAYMAVSFAMERGYQGCKILLVTDCQGVWKIWKAGKVPHFMDAAADMWKEIRRGLRVHRRWVWYSI